VLAEGPGRGTGARRGRAATCNLSPVYVPHSDGGEALNWSHAAWD